MSSALALAPVADPSCFGACTGCGRHGIPYEHRGITFGGLCAYRGDRLCPACRDARMAGTGVSILVVSYQPQIPPHVVNTVRDRDTAFAGLVFPEQRGGYGPHPADRKIARWKRAGPPAVKAAFETAAPVAEVRGEMLCHHHMLEALREVPGA